MDQILTKYKGMLKRLNKIKVNYQFHFENAAREKDEIKCKVKLECVDKRISIVEGVIKDLMSLNDD